MTMTIEKATDLIFQRLCDNFKVCGLMAGMSRGALGSEIPDEIFMAALRELRGPANDQDLRIEFIGGDPDQIRLGASWRGRCEGTK